MRRVFVCAFALCWAASLFAGEAPDTQDEYWFVPELKVTATKEAPKIDGVLDDAAWRDAATSDSFALKEGSKAQGKSKLYVTHDDTTLYLAMECFENPEALKKLKANAKQHDTDHIWADDSIELFIDPTGKRESYYQIIINAKGVTWDAYHASPSSPDKSWEPEYKTAVKVGATSWICEVAIPLKAFSQTARSEALWAFDISRTRSAAQETTYWAPVYNDGSHHPDKFGKLSGMPVVVLNGK